MNYRRKTSDDIGKYSHSKAERKELKELSDQLLQSRIAVEHMAQFKKDEKQNSKSIDSIREQLQYCVIRINSEQKKQSVLNELVSVLKGEMTKIEAKDKEIKAKEEAELEKSLKQLRDDIDKISQKKNQQVARIAVLKENANSCRSERVVYSNLFKKIERELKQHEQSYKSELLNSEKTKIQIEVEPMKTIRTARNENEHAEVGVKINASHITLDENGSEVAKIKNSHASKSKINRIIRTGRSAAHNNHNKEEEKQFYLYRIQQLEETHNKIRAATACESAAQIIEQFNKLEEKNEELHQKIEMMNAEIDEYEHARDRIVYEEKQKQFVEEEELRRGQKNFDQFPTQSPEVAEKASFSHFQQVCSLFKISFNEHGNFDEMARSLDAAISEMSQAESNSISEISRKSTIGHVDGLLLKMQKFELCEKLLDREGFFGEYKKQLNRKTKIKHRK